MLLPGLDGPRAPVRLRPDQARAVEALRAYVERVRRILLVAPTGAGKTVVAASIMGAAAARGERVLFLAHRRELIQQTYRKLLDLGVPEDEVGVIMATDPPARSLAPTSCSSTRRTAPRRGCTR